MNNGVRIISCLIFVLCVLAGVGRTGETGAVWENPNDWHIVTDGKSTLNLHTDPDGNHNWLRVLYKVEKDGGWTIMSRKFPDLSIIEKGISFSLKANGTGDLEIKFLDADGSMRIKRIPLTDKFREWTKFVIYRSDIPFGWKQGKGECEFQLGFSGGGQGAVLIDDIGFAPAGTPSTVKKEPAQDKFKGKVTASTEVNDFPAVNAIDGRRDTRWSSGSNDNEWLLLEFDEKTYISGLLVHWETAFAREYDVLTSTDGNNWDKAWSTNDSDGGADEIHFKGRTLKFLKLQLNKRATGWGNSIWEIELLGKKDEFKAQSSINDPGFEAGKAIDGKLDTFWKSSSQKPSSFVMDLGKEREIGGLILHWGDVAASNYKISFSCDGKDWDSEINKKNGNGGVDPFYFAPLWARFARIEIYSRQQTGCKLAEIEIKDRGEALNHTRLFKVLAQEHPKGWFPKWLNNEQLYWTVVGLEKDLKETIFCEDGSVEPESNSFLMMPYLFTNGKLISAEDAEITRKLEDGYLPIPSVTWKIDSVLLEQTAIAAGSPGASLTRIRYRITNAGAGKNNGKLFLVMRPLQANPPWQHGGDSPIREASTKHVGENTDIFINGRNALVLGSQKAEFGVSVSTIQDDIIDSLAMGKLPVSEKLQDESGALSAAIEFEYAVKPGESKEFEVVLPLGHSPKAGSTNAGPEYFKKSFADSCNHWRKKLNRVSIDVPQKEVFDVFRANVAYLLINADRDALFPGSRNYERSWIRDGAVQTQALLDGGYFDEAKNYLLWVMSCQMENGRVPCMLELNGKMPSWGTDWVEWDGPGAYVFAVASCYRFTQDKEFLDRIFPSVEKALLFLKSLRAKRLTEDYKQTCFYGVLPESNSHEGYFPAVHSLWDDFWALKGWKDGQFLAKEAGHPEKISWMKQEEEGLRENLVRNIKLCQKEKNFDYIPGCFEKGDIDTTSTAISVWPAFEHMHLPEKSFKNTFRMYYENSFLPRLKNGLNASYTPYEIRTANACIVMGERKKTVEMLNYFFRDMRPREWLHWAEVVHADYRLPAYIGDMPHTWIGAIEVNFIRNMFVYERDGKDLVFAAGIDPEWLERGVVSVRNLPTHFGEISCEIKKRGNKIAAKITGPEKGPRNVLFSVPTYNKIKRATVDGKPVMETNGFIPLKGLPAVVVVEI